MVNDKKIIFIICVNNELFFNECLYYIKHLHKPDGYEIDVVAMRSAASISSAYNAAMNGSDAKYKIYMHQDLFLLNKNIISDVLELFRRNPHIGMVGLIGTNRLPLDGIMYKAWNCGNAYASSGDKAFLNCLSKNETEVVALDGMFMATQYDIPWREDVIRHWDFYDISHSFEFIKRGYQLRVPGQEKPWCFHDCGNLNLMQYDEEKKNFWAAYQDHLDKTIEPVEVYTQYYKNFYQLMMELKEQLKQLILRKEINQASEILEASYDGRFVDTELAVMKQYFLIKRLENATSDRNHRFASRFDNWDDIYNFYQNVKFLLRRIEFNTGVANAAEMASFIRKHRISPEALKVIIDHTIIKKQFVLDKLLSSN